MNKFLKRTIKYVNKKTNKKNQEQQQQQPRRVTFSKASPTVHIVPNIDDIDADQIWTTKTPSKRLDEELKEILRLSMYMPPMNVPDNGTLSRIHILAIIALRKNKPHGASNQKG